jgi:hypothetical protein
MSECPNCERYKESAKNWRHKAYELSGHPLPWEGSDTWVGLTDEEMSEAYNVNYNIYKEHVEYVDFVLIYRAIEAKLKEKNT